MSSIKYFYPVGMIQLKTHKMVYTHIYAYARGSASAIHPYVLLSLRQFVNRVAAVVELYALTMAGGT